MPSVQLARQKMEKAVDALRREFSTVRTGKATPQLLDTVRVEANIGPVEKAILTSDLGVNPSNDGKVIRVPIPALTEERRREYVKVLHKMAEEARIAIRSARHDALNDVKERLKEKEISEDDSRREQAEVQKVTDQYNAKIDEVLKHKEAELLEV